MSLATGTRRPRSVALVEKLAGLLDRRTSRRGFLSRTAVVGSALAVAPTSYVLRPGTAYANVCGTDSTCGSGYTVFCATINNGVNRCPPNALVGGWWKADNSGFCCGSARYYIDCHSYCSCGCGGGSRFCGEGCRSCSCGCGPSGSCDQRRVCCNNFRYGQCMQHVTCTGPVWCRVVTCTPPWRVAAWRCTTTPATDNRTGQHTAPGLPSCTGIDRKYTALGGPGSFLGEATTPERPAAGGAFTDFDAGSIYWSGSTGAFEVHGAIRDSWRSLGAERSPLGFPVTDEVPTADGAGRYNVFRGAGGDGVVLWSPSTGAHGVWGAIRERHAALGAEGGVLGYPTTSERASRDGVGRYNLFRGSGGDGIVLWTPRTGAHAVWGEVFRRYASLGREDGVLGYPTTSEQTSADGVGRFNLFDGAGTGIVLWTPSTGAQGVWGAVFALYAQLGRETGPLGYPTTTEQAVGDGAFNDFVGGGSATAPAASVYWSPRTGARSVRGRIRAAWLQSGGATGPLGFPKAEARTVAPDRVRQDFERGWVEEDTRTGQTTVQPQP